MNHPVPCTADARAFYWTTGTCADLMLRLKTTPSLGMNVLAPRHGGVGCNERVFGEAMHTVFTPFARDNTVDEAWRRVHPARADDTPLRAFAPRHWRPADVQSQAPAGRWHDPERASR